MTARKSAPARNTTRRVHRERPRAEPVPPVPDRRLWEADRTRAFEAGVRWFLAVSRAA